MKRIILTLSIIASIAITSTSCSNDEPVNAWYARGELKTFEDSLAVTQDYVIEKLNGGTPDPITYERIRVDCVNQWVTGEAVAVVTIGTKTYKADLHQMSNGDWTWIGYNECKSHCDCTPSALRSSTELKTLQDSLDVGISYAIEKLEGLNPEPITYERIGIHCINHYTSGHAILVVYIGNDYYSIKIRQNYVTGDWVTDDSPTKCNGVCGCEYSY